MRRLYSKTLVATILVIVMGLLFAGCKEDETPYPPPPPESQQWQPEADQSGQPQASPYQESSGQQGQQDSSTSWPDN